MSVVAWIHAMRLRTLPLSVACISMGGVLAYDHGHFKGNVLVLSILTTIFLQILSNLANDYGDTVSGVDHAQREGPQRMMQSGQITSKAMKVALVITTVAALLSGTYLLRISALTAREFNVLLLLGVLSIIAAVTYTMGKRPYGYMGLGDLSVFVFFGWIGVGASYYLMAKELPWYILLAASSCSLFSVVVLNINNIRDIKSDKMAGKISIPVRIGRERAVQYNWFLIISGFLCTACYIIITSTYYWQWLIVLSIPLLWHVGRGVQKNTESARIDPFLKKMAFTTLLFVLLFTVGTIINNYQYG